MTLLSLCESIKIFGKISQRILQIEQVCYKIENFVRRSLIFKHVYFSEISGISKYKKIIKKLQM